MPSLTFIYCKTYIEISHVLEVSKIRGFLCLPVLTTLKWTLCLKEVTQCPDLCDFKQHETKILC